LNSEFGAILAFSALLLVAGGLLFAAIYALRGKPKSTTGKRRKRQIVSGFRLAGGVLAGFVLVGALVAGVGVGFCGVKPNSAPLSFSSRPLALAIVGASLTLLFQMVHRWAKYLGGWIAYGALNGLIMASSGHVLNNPAIPVRRSSALIMTAIAISSALFCLRFTDDYKLSLVDRIAVVGWVLCFAFAVNERLGIVGMTLGAVALALAWVYHRLRRRAVHQR